MSGLSRLPESEPRTLEVVACRRRGRVRFATPEEYTAEGFQGKILWRGRVTVSVSYSDLGVGPYTSLSFDADVGHGPGISQGLTSGPQHRELVERVIQDGSQA